MNAVSSEALPVAWRRVRIVLIGPVGYLHTATFQELAEGLAHAFAALGAAVDVTHNDVLRTGGVNIVLGAHLLSETPEVASLPLDAVIVNLEQMETGAFAQQDSYIDLLRRHRVWDYSPRNIAFCQSRHGLSAIRRLRIGYVPQLTRIANPPVKDVDVLFYGSVNARRKLILDGLQAAGLRVHLLMGVFGADRDAWIARSKIVLNVHFYDDKVHEIVRSSYLLANGKAVVCECDDDTEIDDDIRQAVVAVPYDKLVRTCVALAGSDELRLQIESRALAIFRARDQPGDLRMLVAQTPPPVQPTAINLGSGSARDADHLDVGADLRWGPDLEADLSGGAWIDRSFTSARCGEGRLAAGGDAGHDHTTIRSKTALETRSWNVQTAEALRFRFDGDRQIAESYSQALQDIFVLSMLGGKRDGRYLEIGAAHPVTFNNTFLLSAQFGWRGTSVDFDPGFAPKWLKHRPDDRFYVTDAIEIAYTDAIGAWYGLDMSATGAAGAENRIDYLQLDIDPSFNTLRTLKALPLDRVRFSVITFETDIYVGDPRARDESRQILSANGYTRVAEDVCVFFAPVSDRPVPFEDWWVDSTVVPRQTVALLQEACRDHRHDRTAQNLLFGAGR